MTSESPRIQCSGDSAVTLESKVKGMLQAGEALAAIEQVDEHLSRQTLDAAAVYAAFEIFLFQKDSDKLLTLTHKAKQLGLWELRLCESIAKALFAFGRYDDLRLEMYTWLHHCSHRPDVLEIALGTFQAIKDRDGATQAKARLIDHGLSNPQVYRAYREFLARLGITSFSGKYLCETPPHHHRPRLLHPIGGEKSIVIDSLTIDVNFNFSNFLIQLANAIQFAERAGLKVVHASYCGAAEQIFPDPTPVACSESGILIVFEQPAASSISLAGCYFFLRETFPFLFTGMASLRQCLQSFLHATNFAKPISIPKQVNRALTMHIRSGDIFKEMVHPFYGQPPLSYYLAALKHYNPSSVLLVYEDDANPVVAALRNRVFSENIDVQESSSSDAFKDAMQLAVAEAIVIGAGSFAIGPLCFNRVVHTLYTFNNTFYSPHLPSQGPNKPATHYNVTDCDGEYVNSMMNGNWANTPEQRNLMLTYPEERLRIEALNPLLCEE